MSHKISKKYTCNYVLKANIDNNSCGELTL